MPSLSTFMMPAGKCITAMPQDKLESVVRSLVSQHIGCVPVVDPDTREAVGLVTKQDVNRMFLDQVPLDTPVCEVMSKTLHLATPDMTRDGAAEVLQKHKIHHAVVQNIEGKFAGVFSSWDIARECALDAKAWPYNRTAWLQFDQTMSPRKRDAEEEKKPREDDDDDRDDDARRVT